MRSLWCRPWFCRRQWPPSADRITAPGRLDRIRAGLKSALLIGLGWSGIAIALIYLTANYLIRFIASSSNPAVIYWGVTYIRLNVLFLIVCLCVCVLRNTMQGFGNRKIPVISSLIELVGKVIFAFALAPVLGYWGIIWSEPVVWFCHGDPAGGQYRADVPAKRRLNLRKKGGRGFRCGLRFPDKQEADVGKNDKMSGNDG